MDPISSLSKIDVKCFVTGADGSETVGITFTADVEPSSGDWKAGEWETTTAKGAVARITIGPGSTAVLADGMHEMWIRMTGTRTRPVFAIGQVVIT